MKLRASILLCASLLCLGQAHAQVQLPALLSDGMMVQRDLPVHYWGMAAPGEKVTVTFRGEEKTATADPLGHWNVYLSPGAAGGPFEATIRGTNTIAIHDILVGDIWVASGQSNMEWPLIKAQNGEAEVSAATCPNIRLLEVKKTWSDHPNEDVTTTGWHHCSPETIRDFSAIGYYFAREIQQREKVPVAIIASYWGGTQAESWTSMDALAADPALMVVFQSYGRMMDEESDRARIIKLESDQFEADKAKGLNPAWPKWRPDPHMWQPAALFNGMIAPLTPLPIKGVIWYQGESNSIVERQPQIYGHLFETMIRDWRAHWAVGDFPFLYVQISAFTSTPAENWPLVREGQRRALAIRNTGMAVSIDIGNPDDVHPLNKKDIGARLALLARSGVYGEEVEAYGPTLREITRESGALRLWFDHTRGGLKPRTTPVPGFEVAGVDGAFHPAEVRIDGATIVASSAAVADPVSVRYGWANSPDCQLFNGAGLPASPFTATLPALH